MILSMGDEFVIMKTKYVIQSVVTNETGGARKGGDRSWTTCSAVPYFT
jgi:hypothetical protein